MNLSQNFTALSVPLSRTAPNFAPAKPIADAIQNKKLNDAKSATGFEKAIRERYNHYLKHEKISWDEAISAGQLVSMFINGDQLLQRRPYGPGYYVRPLANDDTYRQTAMNMMRFYYQCCETKMISSNPTVALRAGGDQPIDIAAAQAARPVVDYWESQFYTAKFSRREALYAATNGLFIHRVRWNPFKGECMAQSQSVGQQNLQIDEGLGECAECQHQGTAEDFPATQFGNQCAKCGSAAVDVRPPQQQSMSQVSIGPAMPVGEPEIIQCPFAAWRWDLSKELEDSSWAIYRQRITQGAIKLILGDAVLPDSESSDDRGLDILHALAYGGQAFGGATITSGERRNSDKRPTMAEFWMSEEDYAGIDLEEGKTVSGHLIPGGKMREHFKGPICVVGLNDMSLVVGVYQNESHKTEVVTGQWFMKSDSGAGRGMQDTASVQRRFNAVDGQVYQGLAGTATPAVMTDLRILKEDQSGYLFKPNTTIDVNLSMLPPGMGLKDAVYLGTPGNVNQQYIQYGSVFLKDMFQVSSLVTEFSDFMSIDNRTATGAQITAALANSLFGPMLLTKGEARVRIAKILVQLCAKYGQVPRYFPGKGAARGRTVGGAELKGKVIYELEQNSELPATPYTQQTDIRVLLETMGGIQGLLMLKQADPPLFRSFVAPFNVKLESEDSDMVSTICLTRLEQMESNLQMGVNDPQMLVQSLRPPVSVVEPKHKEKAEWWSDFLDLDTGMSAPPEIRAAAEAMYYLHQNLDAQKSMPQAANQGLVAGIGQAAAGAPGALGAQALQPEDTSGQEQQAEHEHEAELHARTQEMDLQKASLQAKTQMTVAQIQGDNAITTAKIGAKSKMDAAKRKPRTKVA